MEQQTTFPHFIKVTGVMTGELFLNANLIEEIRLITHPTSDCLKQAKSAIRMSGDIDDEGLYVLETPSEILEIIYHTPNTQKKG